jgi:hypothetical protein
MMHYRMAQILLDFEPWNSFGSHLHLILFWPVTVTIMTSLLTWIRQTFAAGDSTADPYSDRPAIGIGPARRQKMPPGLPKNAKKPTVPEPFDYSTAGPGRIADGGPGKNVLIRSRHVREDTGTHETLKILDHSVLESEETEEFDPYNTGRFDRAKSWDAPARKK